MKRKLFTGVVFFFAAIVLTLGMLVLLPSQPLGNELKSSPIDTGTRIELHFKGYNIKLISWNKDSIKVDESQFHRNISGENIEITSDANTINAESENPPMNGLAGWIGTNTYMSRQWLSLMQFDKYSDYWNMVWDNTYVDFYIYVPKGIPIDVYCNGVVNTPGDINFNVNWSNLD